MKNEAKIEMLEGLKKLLETYGTEHVLNGIVEATENLMGAASNVENERYATRAAKVLASAARMTLLAEERIGMDLEGSLEVLIEATAEEG